MGLFDRIKKAFSGEQNEEPEKQEEVVKDQSASENGDEVETEEVVETSSSEESTVDTDEEAEETSEQTEESMELPPQEMPTQESEVKEEPVDSAIGSEEAQVEQTEIESTPIEPKTESETIEVIASEPENIVPAEPEQPEETVQEKYDKGLEKTRKSFGERMNELFARFRRVDEDFFEDLEETLIGADVGFDTAIKLTDSLRQEVKLKNAKKPSQVQNVIIEKLVDIYEAEGINENNAINLQNDGLSVILFVGVNGTGKTTSIGKLANQYKNEGKKVLLAAADTFRAGAIDQLVVWGQRSGVEVVRGNAGGDPAAVVFDAVDKAKNENYDILLIDTAGRLQNKVNLMNELEKIKRVIQREFPSAPHEVLLVVDATTGQNALVQARQFKETTDVTGLVLTKLDGTAKGGIVLAIRNELHLPVKLVGLGEGLNDLEAFNPNDFAVGLFKGLLQEE
ncbi:signal recognition particle-docking protein FtsY [Enterococcus raffinosus]|uniref:signal recognition particle-docking protein FtsY n=1 Tax=Enterococcus raffinosus TaxID=71452 RepID=UPI001C12883A|nr:signal recognition particle-docking protein FtsY [Enterococcus raffinosus]MBU5359876.1 signal recognition particle-docking protein FtsY [Enterococcus raffinosus]